MKNSLLILKETDAARTAAGAVDSPLFLHLSRIRASARANQTRRTISFPSSPRPARMRRLAADSASSHLVNFPFAITASVVLLIGLLAMGWGMAIPDVPLAIVGFFLSLVGAGLYGWSLSDD